MSAPDARADRLEAELTISSRPQYLGLVRCHAAWFLGELRVPEGDASRLTLALVETVTNVMRHAYEGRDDGEIRIRLRGQRSPLEIELAVLDRGKHVPAGALRGREPGEGAPGGLGLKLMDSCTDSVEYRARDGGGSEWILKKTCSEG